MIFEEIRTSIAKNHFLKKNHRGGGGSKPPVTPTSGSAYVVSPGFYTEFFMNLWGCDIFCPPEINKYCEYLVFF